MINIKHVERLLCAQHPALDACWLYPSVSQPFLGRCFSALISAGPEADSSICQALACNMKTAVDILSCGICPQHQLNQPCCLSAFSWMALVCSDLC